ncbi:MAG: hypothetical protein VX473_07185 [Candidatus Thermoplasmatota archaeon]|nr:hypothetical protein [Candidatus Thermoplasmatota archaeon]
MDDSADESVVAPTVSDLVRNLVSPSTLPHVLLLVFSGIGLYFLSASGSDVLFAIGIAGYIGLSIGYALTAWMQDMRIIHRFSHFQPLPKGTSFSEKIMLYFIRIITTWISPLMLGMVPAILVAVFLTSDTGKEQIVYWGMALGGLFVVWSLAQGRALATSLRIFVEGRAVRIASIQRKSTRVTSTTIHMGIIGIFASLTYWALILGGEDTTEMGFIERFGAVLFGIFAIFIQAILFWYTSERRVVDSQRKDTAAFGFSWGLFMQLFVTWHLLSAYRRFFPAEDGWGILLIIEELLLMIITVIAAIWSLAKDTHNRGLKLFTKENAIFWGLSFGVAYSGSIAMISVLGSKLSSGLIDSIGMSATIGIGHLITAATMMWIHAWRIGQLSRWLDDARDEQEKNEEGDDSEDDDTELVEEEVPQEPIEEIDLDIPPPITSEDDEVELVDLD